MSLGDLQEEVVEYNNTLRWIDTHVCTKLSFSCYIFVLPVCNLLLCVLTVRHYCFHCLQQLCVSLSSLNWKPCSVFIFDVFQEAFLTPRDYRWKNSLAANSAIVFHVYLMICTVPYLK